MHKYYVQANFANTIGILQQKDIPASVPVIDIVAGLPIFFMTDDDFQDWKNAHKTFADKHPNRQGIVAEGSGHYIFKYNEVLFLNAVTKLYAETLTGAEKTEVLHRGITMSMERANIAKKEQMDYLNSEANLKQFASRFLKTGEIDKALDVLKLNMTLFPNSWKTYDNYAKVLLKAERKAEAIAMYEKSIALNSDNKNSKKVLEKLKEDQTN